MVSDSFAEDRSCHHKLHMAKKPLLGEICEVFQELCGNPHCVFGNGITQEQAKVLAVLARPMKLKQGDVVCREGDPVDGFVVIIRGSLSESTVASSDPITHVRGGIIGEVGLLDGLDKGHALVSAIEESLIVSLPYRKFISFLERSGGDTCERVLGFVTRVLFPELMAIEGARMSHASAVLLQCAMRQAWAIRQMVVRRHRLHLRKALIIQHAWRWYAPRLRIWRELRKPFGRRLQCAVRMLLARRKVEKLRWIKGIMTWYSSKTSEVITVQRNFRRNRKKQSFKKQRSSSIKRRTYVNLDEDEVGQFSGDGLAGSDSPDSQNSHMESPLGVASRQLNIFRASSDKSARAFESEINQNDLAALRKWLLRDMAKCFTAWKRQLRETLRKRQMMKNIVKSLKFGNHYYYFKRWRNAVSNAPDLITPWRARAGQMVQLSAEGKEYEFSLGRRLQGDDGIGILLSPLLQDKTVWKVQWKSSTLIGAYFTGSCGRYFLKRVFDKKKKRRGIGSEEISTLSHGLEEMREAMDENLGVQQVSMAVTPPFGATIGMSCPPGSPWRLEAKFLPKSVQNTVTVSIKALEASEFGCSRNELGIVVSPVLQIRHRTWRKFSKPFNLRIPHRCSSPHKLLLFHWPEDQIFCDKIPGAEFTDEECMAEVSGFGLYAVINTDMSAPDVVFGKLDVGRRWRDDIGKMVTRMNLGTTHRGNVKLIPRGCAEECEGVSRLLPCFHLRNGIVIEKVDAVPDIKLEGCILNCWSGRVKYKGGLTSVAFSIIIQTSPVEPLPFNMPLFDCSILLKNANNHILVSFSNGNHVRMKVTTVQLCIQVAMPAPLAAVHYECMLQGRETLRDIRVWVAKCFAGASIENRDLDWFTKLRFLGEDDEHIPLNVEKLDPASNHLPKIRMIRAADESRSETPENAIMNMSFDIIQQTRRVVREVQSEFMALPESPTRSYRSFDGLVKYAPVVGCPIGLVQHQKSSISRPSTGAVAMPLLYSRMKYQACSSFPSPKQTHLSSRHSTELMGTLGKDYVKASRPVSSVRASISRDTTRSCITSNSPRIPQTIIATPKTPNVLDVTRLKRFNMTLDQYGCATPRQQLPSRRHLAQMQQSDPPTHQQAQKLKLMKPLITPRSQRILEDRRDKEQCRIQDALGRMFPHPPGSRPDDQRMFIHAVMHEQKSEFAGPKSPEPTQQPEFRLRRVDSSVLRRFENDSPASKDSKFSPEDRSNDDI